jgi:LacI family transcriptional regulator
MIFDSKTPTIYDVARLADVSLATVSRVINNNGTVKEATKKRVQDAIKQLNYFPNALAKGLATSKTTTIGLLMPDLTDLYYSELAQGIDAVAKMYSYSLVVTVSDDSEGTELGALNSLLEKQVDGIIFMGSNPSQELLNALYKIKTPLVFSGSVDPKNELPSVNIDYENAFKQATDILKQSLNDEEIALVVNPIDDGLSLQRKKGFLSVAKKGKYYDIEDSYMTGYELGSQLLENKIKAVVVADDEPAVGILNYMQDHNVSIPEDFQIISGSDTKLVKMTRPSISTISQPKFDIGAVSMRLLTKLLNNEEIIEKNVILNHDFILRNTTI